MKMRILLILVILLMTVVSFAAGKNNVSKPNFLFVLGDDCTFRDIGCYGGQASTPNIDTLAANGMKFSQSFQAAPMCSPTRHNIYTGIYPVKSGAYPNHTFAKNGTKSIVHYLKPLGYRVGLSGKRHISPQEVFPFEYLGKGKNPDFGKIDTFIKDAKDKSQPFCLFACSNEPHRPYTKGDPSIYPPAKIKLPPYFVDTPETRSQMSKYLAEITYLDWQLGELLNILDKHKLADNTLVIFTSEQGSGFPFAKWTCYDSGLQNALIARWPGKIKSDSVSDAMIEYVDITPTFVEAAGGIPAKILDGKSFLPVMTGKKNTHKDYVYGIMTTRGINNGSDYYGIRNIRSKNYKYINNLTPDVQFKNDAMRTVEFRSWLEKAKTDPDAADKVRRYQHRPAEELYDIKKDPYEWNNLAGDPKYANVKADLKQKLKEWMKAQGDKGQQTELEAFEHQVRNRNKNKKQTSKSPKRKRRDKTRNP